ncbi:NEW3 domain-containing protein [Actinopolymorpha alba]|uniref:golvesin C-terminal-like domain-containing protein n=1 Tax=Actinopolymorpha alba TaxID=533267 RepID=UPI00037A28AE|nr:NEW3 domain-containing protein [Actinopolymorpha alba]
MDDKSTLWIGNQTSLRRRTAIGLLLSAAILPPIQGALASPARAEGPRPASGSTEVNPPLADALRRIAKPNLRIEQVARLTGRRHRVTFYEATWDGGRTYVRDLEVKTSSGSWVAVTDPEHRFDEQWVVLTGDFRGGLFYYYGTMTQHWVAFDSLSQVGERTVELRAGDEAFDLVVRWTLDGDNPELQWTLAAKESSNYLVGYQAFDAVRDADVDEVLCGALQHAKVIGSPAALSAWELFAPMALTERKLSSTRVTTGVYVPSEVIAFEHERALGSDQQPFGMSLRNDSADVTPTVYAPQYGPRAAMRAGQKRGYAFGLCALPGSLYEAYTDLCRKEYGYQAYRENVYDTSLTDTIHNIVDLLSIEPESDDSTTFVPSFSGWWNRAKGFIDVENDQCVRTPISGVLLSAYNLTSPPALEHDLYQARARHLIEYQLSRKGIGYTPIKGKAVYGDTTQYRVGKVPGDAATLGPLYLQTRGQNAGIHKLAMDVLLADKQGDHRTPVSVPLAGYLLTRDPAYLAEATTTALRYIHDLIDTPYTTNVAESSFGYAYAKGWTELLVLYELTGDRRFLEGAHKEAKRFVTQTEVRPVPKGNVTAPIPPVGFQQFDWPTGAGAGALPDYPREEVTPQTAPAWYVSTSGLTFEQLTTFKIGTSATQNPGGGFVFNPCWVPFLLRLAHYTGDQLIADIAHNMVVGRFTNYPGYYSRQFHVDQMKPDFPMQGPPGIAGIYFHHAPAQLGLAIDYLLSEQFARSGGAIDFPRLFELNYVYFKFSVYGHAPGTFYGENAVWPYFPKGLVKVDNPAVNWCAGVGNSSLYVSLTNESGTAQKVTVDVASPLTGIKRGSGISVAYVRGGKIGKAARQAGTATTVTVPPKGIAAFVVRDVEIDVPWHVGTPGTDRSPASYHSEDTNPSSDFGLASGILLVRPDRSGYDAYVSIDTEEPSTLRYRIGDGPRQEAPPKPFPYEWTIGVGGLAETFSYQIISGSLTTDEVTLRLPASVTGAVDGVGGELVCTPTTTPGDKVALTARVRNGTDADLTGLAVTVNPPSGWTVTPAGGARTVPAHGVADVAFSVSVPADASIGDRSLSASVTWNGGTADLDSTTILVRQPRKVTSLTVPTTIAKPGDQAELVTTVLNSGPVPVSAELKLTAPAGWSVTQTTVTLEIPARSERAHTFVATSGSVVPGNQYRFQVSATGANSKAVLIKVADAGVIVSNVDFWPSYVETGEWLGSSLAGWNGIQSRYSAPEVLGGTATWKPDLPQTGEYDVAVWYPTNFATTTKAAYVITHAGGVDEVIVNQQENANRWFPLGRYRFEAGQEGSVRIEVRDTAFHRVSAAQFIYVKGSTS